MNISEQIKKIQTDASVRIFDLLHKEDSNPTPFDVIKCGITLHTIINTSNSELLLKILKSISLPEDFRLDFVRNYSESFGQYDLILRYNSDEIEKDIFKFLQVENSKIGVWQAYLLYSLWHHLPLNDHSNYYQRKIIYSSQEFDTLNIADESIIQEAKSKNTDIVIVGNRKLYYISFTYWCPYRGLVRILAEVRIDGNRIVSIEEILKKDLVEYGRDIRL